VTKTKTESVLVTKTIT